MSKQKNKTNTLSKQRGERELKYKYLPCVISPTSEVITKTENNKRKNRFREGRTDV